MSDARSTPDSREEVFGHFYEELEGSADKEAVVRRYATEHPRWAADFRAEAAIEVLVHTQPVPGEPFPADLPDFRVVREVSHGGMGVVYEAEQLSLRRRVALKVRRQRLSPEAQKRFVREQETLAKLHQTHIVPVHTAGQVGPWQYFAMAYIEGAPLHRLVQTAFQRETAGPGPRTPSLAELASELARESKEPGLRGTGFQPVAAESLTSPGQVENLSHDRKVTLSMEYFRSVARVMADAAEALQHAHEKHVLHRDVKPSNILIDTDGKCWLIDFGLAHCNGNNTGGTQPMPTDPPSNAALTRGPLGTPGYMAPEQYREQPEARSDVWGLGVTLYELLTLRPAFNGRTHEEVRAKVLAEEPTPLRELSREVPADLAAICRKAMRKEPGQRYATAGEFAEDLRRWLGHYPVQARPAWVGRRVWLWARRNTGWAMAIALGLATSAALAYVEIARKTVAANEIERQLRSSQRDALVFRLEVLQRDPVSHMDMERGRWFDRAWEYVREVRQLYSGEDLRNAATARLLRDRAAAALRGIDARLRKRFEGSIASSVAVDETGRYFLLGGTDSNRGRVEVARLWDSERDTIIARSQKAGSGPVAFGKDGSPLQLVVGDSPTTLLLWNVAKNERIREFTIPWPEDTKAFRRQGVQALALSKDGSLLAVAAWRILPGKEATEKDDQKGMLVVWDTKTDLPLVNLPIRATALAFSAGNDLLAAADTERVVHLWALPKAEKVASFPASRFAVLSLAFSGTAGKTVPAKSGSPLQGRLAVGDAGAVLTIWDLALRQRSAICRGSHHHIFAAAFSPDGMTIASGGRGGHIHLWDAATGKPLLRLVGYDYLSSIAFAPDGKQLVAGTDYVNNAGGVLVWELENGRGVQTLGGLTGQVEKLHIAPNGRFLAALSQDWQLAVWDLREGRLLRVLELPPGTFSDNTGIAFDADGSHLAFAGLEYAKLWRVDTGEEVGAWNLPYGLTNTPVFRSGKELCLLRAEYRKTPSGQARVCPLYQLPKGAKPRIQKEITDFPLHVYFMLGSPDGRFFVVRGKHRPDDPDALLFKVYDANGEPLDSWEGRVDRKRGDPVLSCLDATGRILAWKEQGSPPTMLVELPSRKWLHSLAGTPDCISPDTRYWAQRLREPPYSGFSLYRWNDKTPLLTLGLQLQPTGTKMEFNAAGTHVAWGNADGSVLVCDIPAVQRRLAEVGLGW